MRIVTSGLILDADGFQCRIYESGGGRHHPGRFLDLAHVSGYIAWHNTLDDDSVLLVFGL